MTPAHPIAKPRRRTANSMTKIGLLKAILTSATDYAIITMNNEGIITSWNTGAQRILEYQEEEIIGESGGVLFTAEDQAKGIPQEELETARLTGRAYDNRWHVRKDGSKFWGDGTVTPIYHDNGAQIGFLKIMYDCTERKQIESEMIRLANFDALTGLANRSYFQNRLSEMVSATLRSSQHVVLLLIDLDNFKQINDSMGHHVGDLLLQQTAQRMRRAIRDTDFLARLGGDEFVVIQPNALSPQSAGSLINKLLDTLSRPFHIDGHEVRTSASIGVAVCPQDAKEPNRLLNKADLALYRVKNEGRGGFSYFTEQMDAEAHKRHLNLSELRRAVKNHAFWLEYQPEIDVGSKRIVSIEALLRCSNPTLRAYPITEVIKLGEETGLMPEIGLWVLSEACAQSRRWQNAGLPVKISVNLSPRELIDLKIATVILAILDRSGLTPRNLEVEITEQHMFQANGQGIKVLEELRNRGIIVVLDDFGTGYASLSSLRRLPVNRLKLDRASLKEIPHDPHSCAIAKAVIAMAHTLNIEVVAEGIESAEQADFFRREGCNALQGNFLSRPLATDDMTLLLQQQFSLSSTEKFAAP